MNICRWQINSYAIDSGWFGIMFVSVRLSFWLVVHFNNVVLARNRIKLTNKHTVILTAPAATDTYCCHKSNYIQNNKLTSPGHWLRSSQHPPHI